MTGSRGQLLGIWRRTVSLGWPIAVQQTLNTLMRTVDIVVTGLFSPAAVAAVGLADLYAQIPLRVGLGLGTGAIALSSQDTGRGAERTRDAAITQALAIGFCCGIPFVLLGLLAGPLLIAALGAESEVVRLGGLYLTLVFAAAPMRIVGIVGARSLQGTGDTRTPMVVNGGANALNIVLTVVLGLGIWIAPGLGIVGVGIATAVSRTFEAVAIVGAIAHERTRPSLVPSTDATIARQLVAVSVPNFAEGMSTSVANFPFNALLLLFGTEVNAAYHIGRRIYQQLTGPLYRSFGTASSIIVGQTLGEGDPDGARFAGHAILALGVITLGFCGVVLFVAADPLARIFTQDPTTIGYAAEFTRVFGVSMLFFGIFFPLAGALRGAGDTRTPFYARFVGAFAVMLGVSYVAGIVLGYGLPGVYAGIVLSYVCWAVVVGVGFRWGGWAETAANMMEERADAERQR
ncbi:MATE family efflux transporter [Natrononativus amylolyticus]|uniref:MATE family efflux transporter n=1 Tax=Natrononativus amylolyticus TaxID=2963434 RepID=UPI0020CBC8A8|nr:MATE family efflux transporter [Natrononativus amylolyticus]